MKLFDVYPRYDIAPVRGEDVFVWDDAGNRYLDLYGGHAVISIGHSHPDYVKRISEQLNQLGFYSNSVNMPIQDALAAKLGELSGYPEYNLFLTNSGAESIENALKLASFFNGRKRVVAFGGAFHGRTAAAVAVTDNPKIRAPFNETENVHFLKLNDADAVQNALQSNDIAAVIVEGIQGVGGIQVAENDFLQNIRRCCDETGTLLILDEVQSGYGRSGKFFAHQFAEIQPDLITVAKGMGNGFPIGGVLIHPKFEAWHGMLGTTFGGNHLACAAGLAVLEVIESEHLIENAQKTGEFLLKSLKNMSGNVREVRGRGLMIGVELEKPCADLRKALLFEERIFTGVSGKNTIRLLPPLTLKSTHAEYFLEKFEQRIRQL